MPYSNFDDTRSISSAYNENRKEDTDMDIGEFLVNKLLTIGELFDEGEDDFVYNDEWAESSQKDVKQVKKQELSFVNGINWNLSVGMPEFKRTLRDIEVHVVQSQVIWRQNATYSDLVVLWNSGFWQNYLLEALGCAWLSYLATLASIVGLVFAMQAHLFNHDINSSSDVQQHRYHQLSSAHCAAGLCAPALANIKDVLSETHEIGGILSATTRAQDLRGPISKKESPLFLVKERLCEFPTMLDFFNQTERSRFRLFDDWPDANNYLKWAIV